MARKQRFCAANLTYQTQSRCINHEAMLRDKSVKDLMIQVIAETQKRYSFELNGFIISDDSFVFFIKTLPGGETISKILQRIKSVFARRYNKIHGRTGPVWNERFSSVIIEHMKDGARYMLKTLWKMAKGSRRQGRHSPYDSTGSYLDEHHHPRLKITLHEAFLRLGRTFKERAHAFLCVGENSP